MASEWWTLGPWVQLPSPQGVVDVKAFASTTAEKARSEAMQQSREMVENKGSELKDCFQALEG